MSNLYERINAFDFDGCNLSDLAVLLEQIFLHHDPRVRGGGPILVAQGVLRKYEESVRRRAAPELHGKISGRCSELRSIAGQVSDLLRKLERDSAQTST